MAKMTIIEGNSNDKDDVRALMVKGERGYSAYDLYVQNGGTLTEEQWLDEFLNAENFYNKSETDDLLDEKIYCFEKFNDMFYNTDLKADSKVKLLGYYNINDGGGATYFIREKGENEEENGITTRLLVNGLIAEMIVENNKINVAQIGAKSDYNNEFDSTTYLQNAITYCQNNGITLVIPSGNFFVTDTLHISNKIRIVGEANPQLWAGSYKCSRISFRCSDSKPLFNISGNDSPYNFTQTGLVYGVEMSDLRIIGVDYNDSMSLCAIFEKTYSSKFTNLTISNFVIGTLVARSYLTEYNKCYIMGCKLCVAQLTTGAMFYNKSWLQYLVSVTKDQAINETRYTNLLNGYNPPEIITGFFQYDGTAYFDSAIEAVCNGIYNRGGIFISENYLNLERITNTALSSLASNNLGSLYAKNIGLWNDDSYTAKVLDVGYRCKADIELKGGFNPTGFTENYSIGARAIGRVYSKTKGERIVDNFTLTNISDVTYENYSHYTPTGFKVDIQITAIGSITSGGAVRIRGPQTNSTGLGTDIIPAPKSTGEVVNLRIGHDGYINKSDYNWLNDTAVRPHITYEYPIT